MIFENYKDEYRIRVLGMLDENPKHGHVIDIMEALKRRDSFHAAAAKKKRAKAS